MLTIRIGERVMAAPHRILSSTRLWLPIVLLAGFAELPSSVLAEDWMFQRSYYSHVPPQPIPPGYPQPVSRSAYRGAFYRDGFGVRTTYRVNNYLLQNGNRTDWTFYREGWIEFPQRGE